MRREGSMEVAVVVVEGTTLLWQASDRDSMGRVCWWDKWDENYNLHPLQQLKLISWPWLIPHPLAEGNTCGRLIDRQEKCGKRSLHLSWGFLAIIITDMTKFSSYSFMKQEISDGSVQNPTNILGSQFCFLPKLYLSFSDSGLRR